MPEADASIERGEEMDTTVKIQIDSDELDIAIEKASRLAELLGEVQQIISSLSGKEELEA